MTKYAVMFEIERGELVYATGKQPFKTGDSPKIFETKEEAEAEAARWNTGTVVEYK